MQKIFRSIFITKPMKMNYISTIVLNIFALLFLSYLILFMHNEIDLSWHIGLMIFYFIISAIFMIYYREDCTINLGTYSEQLKVDYSLSFASYVIKSFLLSVFYIATNLIIVSFIQLIEYITKMHIFNSFIPFITGFVVVLAITRSIFELTKTSPFLFLGIIIIPFLTFSLVGIEKAVLGWTFLAMFLGMIANQFLSKDLTTLVPEKFKVFIKNEEELEKELIKKKYTLLIFIPILYVSLLISEKIFESAPYIYLINNIHSKHYQSVPTEYFSDFFIWNTFLKLFIVLVAWACFTTCKDWIFETISMKLLDVNVTLNDIPLKNGKYNCVKYNLLSQKLKINENHYFFLNNNNIMIERELKKIGKIYNISDNLLLSDLWGNKTIKYVSNDILKIEDNFFILDKSDTQNEISNSKKQVDLNILKINHYNVWIILFVFIFLFSILTMLITWSMKNSYRGEYVYNNTNVSDKPNFDTNDKIVFSKDDIYIIKKSNIAHMPAIITKYRYDNVTMTIRNNKGDKIGEVETVPNITYHKILKINDDNNEKLYYPQELIPEQ